MAKSEDGERALIGEYARALAAFGEASPSKRSDALKRLNLNTMRFLDLSKQANAVMDRAVDNGEHSALVAFTEALDASRAALARGEEPDDDEATLLVDADTTPDAPPGPNVPNVRGIEPIPEAPAYVPFQASPRPPPPARIERVDHSARENRAPERGDVVVPGPMSPPQHPPGRVVSTPLGRGTVKMVQPTHLARGLPSAAKPVPAVPPRVPPSGGHHAATAVLPRDTIRVDPDDGMPPAEHFREPRLALMQYAALRAEVLACGDKSRQAVYARFGLEAVDDAAESAAWNARFSSDRAIFAQYMQLFNYFRSLSKR